MKRLLAALLTLSMMVSIVPFSAFADSPGATIVPNASATAQKDTSTPVLDEDTVQAIISDPLLQGRYAPEQSQQTQPTVDTSDVTMEATDGFGKLLLNSINEQNDVSSDGNRIIGVSVSDNTAAVEYVTTTNADIVVSIYTDDSAEEMVASGTIYAPAMIENMGSSTVTVDISGTIPEYYTVKCYLLDTAEHAPLCKEYTDSSHTKVLVDIKNATVDDFESDRVINLDDNNSTNFAVVNPGVTLISSDDVPSNQNLLIENDTDNLNYTIDNATDDIKNLHTGSILTYEYEDGKLLIVRVKDISVNGDTVTIHGDDSLTLEDVFTALKVETDAGSDELTYEASADDSVQYLGTTSADFSDFDVSLDEENSYELNGNFKVAHEFKILDKSVEPPPEFSSDHLDGKASLSGTVKISASEEFKFYVGGGKTSVGINLEIGAAGTLTADGSAETFVELASFGFSPVAGVYVGFVPRVVYKSSISGTVSFAITCPFGISYTKEDGLQNTSSKPTCKLNASIEGSIYIGLDFKPTVKILESVLNISLTTEAGATGTVKMNITGTELLDKEDSHHLCKKCFSLSIKGSINLNAELSLLKLPDLTFTLTGVKLETPEKKAYWAPDYHEFGWDDCPHNAYRVSARVITNDDITGSKIESYQDRKWVQIGEVKEKCDGYSETILYLTPGSYRLRVVVGDATYESADFTVDEDPLIETLIKTYVPDPEPGVPTPSDPNYTIENGKLTINNEKVMIDYSDASGTPWYGSRDKITSILTQYSVKTISNYAFADCSKVTEIYIGDEITRIGDYAFSGCSSLTKVTFVGTMAQWKALSIGIGNDILDHIPIVCSDGTISESASPDYTLIDGVLTIFSQNVVNDYKSAEEAPWYSLRSHINKIIIKDSITHIGSFAFSGAAVKEIVFEGNIVSFKNSAIEYCYYMQTVSYNGKISDWKKINFQQDCFDGSYSGVVVYCTDDTILDQGNCGADGDNLRWLLTESKKLVIWGNGEMADYIATSEPSPWWSKDYTTVSLEGDISNIGSSAFYHTPINSIVLPDSIINIGKSAFEGAPNLSFVQFPKKLKVIENHAFDSCGSIKTVQLPDGITTIDDSAFGDCSSLSEIELPDSIIELGIAAFAGTALINAHLPSQITNIPNSTFYNCTKLQSITFPQNLRAIGEFAFYGCSLVDNVIIPDNVDTLYQSAFSNCKNLKTIHLPSNLKNISESLFSNCSSLQKIILPESINSIDSYAFKECTLLEEIEIPSKVQYIGIQAFSGCKNLKTLKIPGSITVIGRNAFENCTGLINVDINYGLWALGDYAFTGCKQLITVVIPHSVKSIGAETFSGCHALNAITYTGTRAQWYKIKIDTDNTFLFSATIHCFDGDILPTSTTADTSTLSSKENSIIPSTDTVASGSNYVASFTGLTPGVNYAVIVSKSSVNPLNPENLIYINQFKANDSGAYQQSFRVKSGITDADMTYVVAAGSYTFDDTPVTPGGGDSGSGGGGGDGGGAAVILGLGAAAAITAGIVLTMPVDVQGRVELADHAAVPGAKVSLLKNGNVVTQTTADESGHFSLKAKRGDYELTVVYTDANGQFVQKTTRIKAPAKDFVVTF